MRLINRRNIGRGIAGSVLCAVAATVVTASPAWAASPTTNCAGTICTVTFTYTGGLQSWTVPAGVTSVNFDVLGASGGSLTGTGAPTGGLGGETKGSLSVTPGDLYFVYVGGKGQSQNTSGSSTGTAGGFNGGGAGGGPLAGISGASGGGASDVRTGGLLSTRLLVAGGGGGAASAGGATGNGGAGGAATGGAGNGESVTNGGGGTPTTGGTAGGGSGAGGTAGQLGIGGVGAAALAGGGGGGYYGGGGGGYDSSGKGIYGPGGGGSSYAAAAVGNVVETAGVQSGSGQVVITYSDDDLSIAGVPSDITTTATGPDGAVVTYTPPIALDPDDATPPAVTCTPSSGATFPIGQTTVTCSATDADDVQGTVTATFTVTVTAATPPDTTSLPTALTGATDVHTGEPWAGSARLVESAFVLGTGLLAIGLLRRRAVKAARNGD